MRVASRLVCLVAVAATIWAGQEIKEGPGETTVPGEIVIRLKPGASLTGVLRSLNITASTVASGTRLPVQVIRVPDGLRQTVSTILANHPQVDYVEPHRVRMVTDLTPNDTSFAVQWWLSKMQAGAAWSLLPGRLTPPDPSASRVRIAVLDTGADCTHPDFRNVIGGSSDSAAGGQFSYSLSQAYVPTTIVGATCAWQDDHGHGTHVAGLLAAATNNAGGVAGLGFPAELMIFKVLGKQGSGSDFDIANAIMTATDGGARIISMSLGGAGYSQLLQDAVNYAWERNSLVIAASGNNNTSALFFPAGANFVLGVGATDSTDLRASFSNYGFGLDVMAPGVSLLSTAPGATYQTMSGTSMATPLVSALAGLIAASTPTLAPDALAQRLEMASESTIAFGGWDQYYGYGRVNALRSLNATLRPATVGGLTGQVVDAAGAPVAGAQVTMGGIPLVTDSTGLFRFSNMSTGAGTLTVSAGVNPPWSYSVVIPPGADSAVRVPLGVPSGVFTGSVTSGGAALAGAIVQALQAGIVQAGSVTDGNGQFTLPVAAGTYALRASAVGHTAYTQSARTVAVGGSTFVPLPMNARGVITGTVVDSSQMPMAGVQITVDDGVLSAGAVTNASGAYTTLGVAAGTYTVSASLVGYATSTTAGVAVIDGARIVSNHQLAVAGAISQLKLGASSIGGGGTMSGNQVILAGPAGAGGATVTLTSSNPAVATVPATVTIPAGATGSALFSITTNGVAASSPITITASLAGASKTASFTVTRLAIYSLGLSTAEVGGGSWLTTNRVILSAPASPGGTVVQLLSSDPSAASLPPSVTVPEGATTSPAFTIITSAVQTSKAVVVTASYAGSVKGAVLTVAPIAVSKITVSPSWVSGGKAITTAVYLNGPAPAGGAVVLLSSSNPVATPPPSVTIPAGAQTSAFVSIPTAYVTTVVPTTIGATYGGVTKSLVVNVKPTALSAFSISTAPISGGKTITGVSVTLDGPAPPSGAVVTVVSSNPAVLPPATVNVGAGVSSSPYFSIPTILVASTIQVTVTASYGGVSKSSILTLNPPAIGALTMSAVSFPGGRTIAGTVTLGGPAPPSGAVVALSSTNPLAAALPPNVVVPSGASAAGFSVTSGYVAAATPVVIAASYGGVSKSVNVTVSPTALLSLTLPTTPNSGGKVIAGSVTLDGPAPPSGAVVSLTSSNPVAAALPANVAVPSGASSAGFSVTTGYVSVATSAVITASYGGVSKSFTVAVGPTSLYQLTLPTAYTPGGKVINGSVSLAGPAPAGGVLVNLISANPLAAAVPPTIVVQGGASTAAVSVTTSSVSVVTPVLITASYGGVSKSVTVRVKPTELTSIYMPSTATSGGKELVGSVSLDGPAPPAGIVVTLNSANPLAASVPPAVTIPAGAGGVAFSATTGYVNAAVSVVITASYGGISKVATVNVKPTTLVSLSVSGAALLGGRSITDAYMSIDGPAPPGGAVVTMTSTDSTVALAPATVTIPSGTRGPVFFTITSSPVAVTKTVLITASYGASSRGANVTVKPAVLQSVSPGSVIVKGGLPVTTAKITLDGAAPAGGAVVTLSSSDPAAQPAANVTVPAGSNVLVFTIPTRAVAISTAATVTAFYNGVSKAISLTINP